MAENKLLYKCNENDYIFEGFLCREGKDDWGHSCTNIINIKTRENFANLSSQYKNAQFGGWGYVTAIDKDTGKFVIMENSGHGFIINYPIKNNLSKKYTAIEPVIHGNMKDLDPFQSYFLCTKADGAKDIVAYTDKYFSFWTTFLDSKKSKKFIVKESNISKERLAEIIKFKEQNTAKGYYIQNGLLMNVNGEPALKQQKELIEVISKEPDQIQFLPDCLVKDSMFISKLRQEVCTQADNKLKQFKRTKTTITDEIRKEIFEGLENLDEKLKGRMDRLGLEMPKLSEDQVIEYDIENLLNIKKAEAAQGIGKE